MPMTDLSAVPAKKLVGMRLTCESKKPGRDIQDVNIVVSASISVPDVGEYLFGVSPDGNVGIHNLRFVFEDSVKLAKEDNFKPQSLDGWFLIPAEDGKFSNHFQYAEKVSVRAQKRLPTGSIPLVNYVKA